MAYRKRVGIAKGMHLNFSGSGIGIGLKLFPGLSYSVNRNGLYCNQSIPGTGFYSRNKIGSWERDDDQDDIQTESQNRLREVGADEPIEQGKTCFEFHGEVTEDNEPVITILRDGRPITDAELSVLKKYDGYKESILNLHKKMAQNVQDETDEVVDIYKLTASPISEDELQTALSELHLESYIPKSYDIPAPTIEDVRSRLMRKAEIEINSILFWTNKSKRKEYVELHLDDEFRKVTAEWKSAKEKFEREEAVQGKQEADRLLKEYEDKKAGLEGALGGPTEYVEAQIEELLSSLQMPVEFSLGYEYDESKKLLMVQLDLPEIENFPARKASILATGKVSVKPKTKYELNNDYAMGVCGLSFFFAGMLYNISTKIQNISINGYTQRINGATGAVEDQYVYSVIFNREQFSKLRFENINPIMALEAFPHRIDLLKTAEMKSINPFNEEEIVGLL